MGAPRASSGPPANGLAAGLATLTSRLALHPLDTLRTRAQRPPSAARIPSSIPGLWAGFPASLAGSVPAQALYYSAYSFLRPSLGVAPAAALANIAAAFIRVPAELLKQRAQGGGTRGPLAAVGAILRADGVRGLWRGLPAQVARDVPYAVALFAVYEALAARGCGGARAGAVAGCFASVVSSPGDLIKTRSMLSGGSARVSIFAVVRAEGVAALWKGTGYRVLYKIASSAVFFACLETYKRLLVRSGRPPA